jgi:hypothetical protein
MLLAQTLATLAYRVAQHVPLALAGFVLVVGAVCRLCGKGQPPSPWVVRKGACPCCGSALFGTTQVYHQLSGLDLVCPESPYRCLTCDRTKIVAVQQHYHTERAEEWPGE